MCIRDRWGDVNVVDRGDRRRQRLSAVRLTEGEKRHSLYVAILFLSFRLFAYAKIHLPRQREAERVEKVDTLLDGNAARSKIKDFRTALYPRQYHPSALEKPLIQRFFAYNVFFRRACQRKNERCGVNAAKIKF